MKKYLAILVVALASFQFSYAQEDTMSLEVQAGIPVGDFSDTYDYGVGVNFTYYFIEVAESLYIGGRGGYATFIGSEDIVDNFDFITLAASARLDFAENFFARADLGYAVGISDNADGAVFYEPRIGYDLGQLDLSVYYQSITEDALSVDSFGLGLAYKF